MKVHQAFVNFKNKLNSETTTFIAEADEKMVYTATSK